MSIFKSLFTMLKRQGGFKRNELLDSINLLKSKYELAQDFLGRDADEIMEQHLPVNTAAMRRVKGFRGNFNRFHLELITERAAEIRQLENYAEELFAKEVHVENLTYEKATLLRYIEMATFYADHVINIVSYQTHVLSEMDLSDKVFVNLKEEVEDPATVSNFTGVIELLHMSLDKVEEVNKKLRYIDYGEDTEAAVSAVTNIDPLKMQFIPVVGNIVVFFGKSWNACLKLRLEELQHQQNILKRKTILMKQRQAGGEDSPELVHQIEYYENLLAKTQDKIDYLLEK